MELKNAVAVCLISLFAATLVVLIARSLDARSAACLEPHLDRIVEELRALRTQGGMAASGAAGSAGAASAADVPADALAVYYFHSNTRCPTCQSIESQSHDAVHANFAPQLERGELVWRVINYEQAAAAPLVAKFEVQMPVVVLARMAGGQIQDWKRLDEVWALEGDKPAFAKFVREQVAQMLGGEKSPAGSKPSQAPSAVAPLPMLAPPDLPVPSAPQSIPLPNNKN